MGSFRRGQPTCGDIDIIVTRDTADGKTHTGFLDKLCRDLKHQGLLIDDLYVPGGPEPVLTNLTFTLDLLLLIGKLSMRSTW